MNTTHKVLFQARIDGQFALDMKHARDPLPPPRAQVQGSISLQPATAAFLDRNLLPLTFIRGILGFGVCQKTKMSKLIDAGSCALVTIMAATIVVGCASPTHPPFNSKTLRETSFLPYPGFFGQREAIKKGERVIVLKKGWGYSRVRDTAGRDGDIPTEDLAPSSGPAPQSSLGQLSSEDNRSSQTYVEQEDLRAEKIAEPFHGGYAAPPPDLDIEPVEPDLPNWSESM